MIFNQKYRKIIQKPELYTIEVFKQGSKGKILFLNGYQQKMLDIIPGKNLTLQIGVTKVPVETAPLNIHFSPNIIYISSEAFDYFPFYQGESLRLVNYSKGHLFLGPALGLTVSPYTWKNIDKSESLKKRAYLALEKGMLFYCFLLEKVDWEKGCVEAYYYNPQTEKWLKDTVPLPQIIYDRGSYPRPETVDGFSQKGNVKNIIWINSTRTFGKWETFQALISNKKTYLHTPDSALFSLEKLKEFIYKYRHVFVKNNYGRCGRKVYRLEQDGDHFLCQWGGNKAKSKDFTDLEKVVSFLEKKLGKYSIIQQGIPLASIGISPFDMRILVQKNIHSQWILSAVNFRIAAPKAIVTNFSAGARDVFTAPGDDLLHPDLSWGGLEKFSLEIVSALEASFGRLGEIGLDVALDDKGKLWLLEANSRPSSIAYRNAPPTASSQIFGLPLDYAYRLLKDR